MRAKPGDSGLLFLFSVSPAFDRLVVVDKKGNDQTNLLFLPPKEAPAAVDDVLFL